LPLLEAISSREKGTRGISSVDALIQQGRSWLQGFEAIIHTGVKPELAVARHEYKAWVDATGFFVTLAQGAAAEREVWRGEGPMDDAARIYAERYREYVDRNTGGRQTS
jgi:hypothetical protein